MCKRTSISAAAANILTILLLILLASALTGMLIYINFQLLFIRTSDFIIDLFKLQRLLCCVLKYRTAEGYSRYTLSVVVKQREECVEKLVLLSSSCPYPSSTHIVVV